METRVIDGKVEIDVARLARAMVALYVAFWGGLAAYSLM